MAQPVIMPKQGQSVESCIITEIRKKPGDKVVVGDVLFSYETDKASFEEESKCEGTVLAVFFNEQDEVPCLVNVMVIGNPGESFEEFAPTGDSAPAASNDNPQENGSSQDASSSMVEVAAPSGPIVVGAPVSPRARKLAEKKGVNPSQVAGTGPGGRIIERDILAVAGAPKTALAKAMMAAGGLEAPVRGSGLAGTVKSSDLKEWKPVEASSADSDFTIKKLSHIRQIIAKGMYNSLQNSAQLTHMLGADARRVQKLRREAKKAYAEGRLDVNITINDFVCLAVIKALRKFPEVNSHCLGDSLRVFNVVNLGCAVDTERGLMVPAVQHADSLDIVELSRQLKQLADDCKKGCVNPDLIATQAASFTVSNLGGYGVEWFTPVLNLPQTGILGVGTIVPRPKDIGGGEYEIVPFMGLSLTYDHRSIDGGQATLFLKEVATQIENLEVEF